MALLQDWSPYRPHSLYSLELTPVTPTREGPRDAYDVTLRDRERIIFQRQYTMYAGTPDGHWPVWQLFRAFQLAERMAKQKTTLNLTGRRVKAHNEPPTVYVGTGWLNVVLSCDTREHVPTPQSPHPWTESRCIVRMFALDAPREGQDRLASYRDFDFRTHPALAVAFGKALEAECREALRLRRTLGITAPADDYIDADRGSR